MGKLNIPPPAMLFAGLIYRYHEVSDIVKVRLTDVFGDICSESRIIPFDFTDYYNKEMGSDLKREFICFKNLIERDELPKIKLMTNEIEADFADPSNNNRRINIDPGYISAENVILSTTKNWTHRPYLADGIYAELEYRFIKKTFTVLEWTYPDYRIEEIISLFNNWRKIYLEELGKITVL